MSFLNQPSSKGSAAVKPEAILNQIRVASPCRESWEAMPGGDRVRACERCQHKVYNLSEMTAAEAAKLVQEAEGRLCVRFYQRADGTMMTKDCPVGLRAVQLRIGTALSAAFAAVSLFFGVSFSRSKEVVKEPASVPATPVAPATPHVMGTPAPPSHTMGAIALPMAPQTPPQAVLGSIARPRQTMGEVTMGKVAIRRDTPQEKSVKHSDED